MRFLKKHWLEAILLVLLCSPFAFGVPTVVIEYLSDLADVNLSSPSDGQALLYNGTSSKWEAGNFSYSESDPIVGAINGIVKADGAGNISAALSGTDYAPATSGTSILKGNGSGGFSSASAGTDYQAPLTEGTDYLNKTHLDATFLGLHAKADTAGAADTATSATTASSCSGNAATATALATARAINGQNFDGTSAITVPVNNANDATNADYFVLFTSTQGGNYSALTSTGLKYHPSTGIFTATGFSGPLTGNVTGDVSGSSGSCTGNSATATSATSLSISGQSGLLSFTGLTSTNRTKTVRDAADTILEQGGGTSGAKYTPTGYWDWVTGSPTVTWPTFNQNTSGTAANLSGTPALPNGTTATTQSAGDNSTKLATTAYADAKVADAINDGTTAIAPSQNAVYDALALKTTRTAQSDYSSSSTVTGWSSFTHKTILTSKIGTRVFVNFYLSGTSNSTTISFTLPYTSASTTDNTVRQPWGAGEDNSTSLTSPGTIFLGANSSTVEAYKDMSYGSAWTNSGSKTVIGEFSYETVS